MRQTQEPSPPPLKPSSALAAESLNLPLQCQQLFRRLSCPVQKVSELSSGIKLAHIVNKIFFDGANASLNNKIKLDNQNRKGNNVVNVNLILKQIRLNKKVEWPEQFMQMTTFKLLDNETEMLKLVNWITESYDKIQIQQKYENQAENSMDKKSMVQSGNLQLKPKSKSKQNTIQANPQNQVNEGKHIKHQKISNKIAKNTNARAVLKTHEDMNQNMKHHTERECEMGYQNSHEYSPTPKKQAQETHSPSPSIKKQGLLKEEDDNAFENIYFCDRDISPDRINLEGLDDSLDKSEKVSKKGSFKVVRPKSSFDDKNAQGNHSSTDKSQDINSPEKNEPQSINGKHNKTENNFYNKFLTDQKQSSARKTIVRMPDRPPIYKRIVKDQAKTQIQQKYVENSSHMTYSFGPPQPFNAIVPQKEVAERSKLKHVQMINKRSVSEKRKSQKQNSINSINSSLANNPLNYNSQIIAPSKKQNNQGSLSNESSIQKKFPQLKQKPPQKQSQLSINAHVNSNTSSRSKNKRSLFKIEIKEVTKQQRKQIMEWLISINLFTPDAANYYQHFHYICSNGIIFPELINHHLGRSDKLYYNKNPHKNSEIRANYQRVFDHLRDLPQFQSELMYMYDYFVPEVLESAFWSFMKSCQAFFHKSGMNSRNKSFSRDSAVKEKLNAKSEHSSVSLKKQKPSTIQRNIDKSPMQAAEAYQKIKYGSSNKFRESINTPEHRNQTPIQKSRKFQQQQQQKQPRRKTSLEFIKQLPQKSTKLKHQQLVQVEQPLEYEPSRPGQGYRDLYELKKNHNSNSFLNTPQKKGQSSASKSRILSSSIKKLQQKPQLPSVSLEMQKKSIDYLTEKQYEKYELTTNLFDHEVRNGVLLNKIIMDEFKTSYKCVTKPRSILDCKQNFSCAFEKLKQLNVAFPSGYECHFEQIIKGKLNMFYGIVYYIITASGCKWQASQLQKGSKKQNISFTTPKTLAQPLGEDQSLQQILFCVRQLQQSSPQIASLQIRDFNTLIANILCHNFLYKLASIINWSQYAIKPNYQHPINNIEQLSNIRKILSFLSHNQIIKAEFIAKAKNIVSKDRTTTINVMRELMNHMKLVNKMASDRRNENSATVISFSKYARQTADDIKKPQRTNQRLETTMANNSFANQNPKKQNKTLKPERKPLEVPWMRRLGFSEDLSLNNGVVLCHLIQKLTMQSVIFNENPTSKAECLTNIRRALKLIDKFNWDEYDIVDADDDKTMEIYKFLKEKYRHSYALKNAG